MATAQNLDKYEDPGMAFPYEQVRSYDPKEAALKRMEHLIDCQNLMYAMSRIPGGQTESPRKMAEHLKKRATGLAYAALIEQPDQSDFNSMDPEYVMGAQRIEDLWEWTIGFMVETDRWITYCTTLGRRAAPRWDKRTKSLSNKMINQGLAQARTAEYWIGTLVSVPRKKIE